MVTWQQNRGSAVIQSYFFVEFAESNQVFFFGRQLDYARDFSEMLLVHPYVSIVRLAFVGADGGGKRDVVPNELGNFFLVDVFGQEQSRTDEG